MFSNFCLFITLKSRLTQDNIEKKKNEKGEKRTFWVSVSLLSGRQEKRAPRSKSSGTRSACIGKKKKKKKGKRKRPFPWLSYSLDWPSSHRMARGTFFWEMPHRKPYDSWKKAKGKKKGGEKTAEMFLIQVPPENLSRRTHDG